MLQLFGQSRLFVGGCQQIATTAIVPFNTGLWQHSSQAFSDLSGKSRQTVKSRHFVPAAWSEHRVVDEFFVHSIRRRFDERLLRWSFARSRQLQ